MSSSPRSNQVGQTLCPNGSACCMPEPSIKAYVLLFSARPTHSSVFQIKLTYAQLIPGWQNPPNIWLCCMINSALIRCHVNRTLLNPVTCIAWQLYANKYPNSRCIRVIYMYISGDHAIDRGLAIAWIYCTIPQWVSNFFMTKYHFYKSASIVSELCGLRDEFSRIASELRNTLILQMTLWLIHPVELIPDEKERRRQANCTIIHNKDLILQGYTSGDLAEVHNIGGLVLNSHLAIGRYTS